MPLRLLQVEEEASPLWDRLMQLYLHDLSETMGLEPNSDGLFSRSGFDEDDTLSRFVILLRNKPAGLVTLKSCAGPSPVVKRTMNDFFILRCYRRLGIGEEVARMIFDQHPGTWQVTIEADNEAGRSFLRKILRRYTYRQCRELNTSDGQGLIFEFSSPPPDAIVL